MSSLFFISGANVQRLQNSIGDVKRSCTSLCILHNKPYNFTISSHIRAKNMLQFVTYRGVSVDAPALVKSFFAFSTLFTIKHLQNSSFFVIIIVSECSAEFGSIDHDNKLQVEGIKLCQTDYFRALFIRCVTLSTAL